MRTRLRYLPVAVAMAMAVCATSVPAQDSPAPAPAPALTESQAQARDLLLGMGRFVAAQERYSVKIRTAYDAIQPNGQRVEFGDRRTVTVRRPDRMRMDIADSAGDSHAIYYDGSTLTAYHQDIGVYAQAPAPKDLDSTVAFFINRLRMRLPLALLLVSRAAEEIERRVTEVDYVEYSTMCAVPCHHIAARTESTDFQVWISAGQSPVPLRVSITYRGVAGEPQFRAELSDWNFAPAADDAVFAFSAPADARKIAFAVDLAPPPKGAAEAAPKEGGQP